MFITAVQVLISLSTVVVLLHVPKFANKFSNLTISGSEELSHGSYCSSLYLSPSTALIGLALANGALRYNMIMPDSEAWMGSLYTSHPSQDSDNAWKELQTGMNDPSHPEILSYSL